MNIYKKVQVGTREKLNKESMKLSAVSKEIWVNIDNKELFPVTTNGGAYGRCDYSITKVGNASILSAKNYGSTISILLFIKK